MRVNHLLVSIGVLGLSASLSACATSISPLDTGTGGASASTGGEGEVAGAGGADGIDHGCADVQCGAHAFCSLIEGHAICLCSEGYEGDGKICGDADKCKSGVAKCSPDATCTNTVGSYTCACKDGFKGDGKTCADVDECAMGIVKCHVQATCMNTPGSFQCTCNPGYMGNGTMCSDVDECADGTAKCDLVHGSCKNTVGSFACSCNPGYELSGTSCVDIDECSKGVCDPNATCTNSPGAYACACNAGFEGDGLSCASATDAHIAINNNDPSTLSTAVTLSIQPPGDLIANASAETSVLTGWQLLQNGGSGWATGDGGLFGSKSFVTSYVQNTRSQTIDLLTAGYTQSALDAAPPINVQEWARGTGGKTADTYSLKVELRRADNSVITSFTTNTVTLNATWQVFTKTFTGYGAGLRYVYFEDGGKDAEYWAGNFGAAMDGAYVSVGTFQMRVSNDKLTWSDFQPFTPTLPWTLSPASGTKTVYIEFKDATGKTWPVVSDTIQL